MDVLRMNEKVYTLYDRCTRGLRPCLIVVDDTVPDGKIQVDEDVETCEVDSPTDGLE